MDRAWILKLVREEADFWDQPPEAIYADFERTPTIEAAEITPDTRSALLSLLPPTLMGVFDHPSPQGDKRLADVAVACALYLQGTAALQIPAVRTHLSQLWQQMHAAPHVATRLRAKRRWLSILSKPLPNVRNLHDPVDGAAVVRAYEDARRAVQTLMRRPHNLVQSTLRSLFSSWRAETLRALASAIGHSDGDGVRMALYQGLGEQFNRHPSSVRTLITKARPLARARENPWKVVVTFDVKNPAPSSAKLQELRARIDAGHRRYMEWAALRHQRHSRAT